MDITEKDNELIKEVLGLGIQSAAKSLNELLSSALVLNLPELFSLYISPKVKIIMKQEFSAGELISVSLKFQGHFNGRANLIFDLISAENLVTHLTGVDSKAAEYKQYFESTLLEIGNIVLNSICGSISNSAGEFIQYSVPEINSGNFEKVIFNDFTASEKLVFMGKTFFQENELHLNGMLNIILDESELKKLLKLLRK